MEVGRRFVPVPTRTVDAIDRLLAFSQWIGITEKQRVERNIMFHSYRHGFNTMVRGKVPDEQLRRVTGHKTIGMSDNYDHAAPEHLADVKTVQEKMFMTTS